MLARRGAHAEGEACRLIGAMLTTDDRLSVPAIAALAGLPADLSDIGGLPELVLEIIRRDRIYTAEGVAEFAQVRGVNIADLRLGSFLAECMDSPAFQPEQAVESIVNFSLYCSQLRAVERLQARAWQGKRIPELTTV